ncbi:MULTISPECIES: aldo/keto reductase [Yersinia]|uniref:aldo/keto reductase n=1 Tax=Yersinia TaxID=629 RepID=UPI0005DB885D|nr:MULTISPECIES: aldo/keto reductase [Yersinia]HEC1650318.1 aldo/keto reductase [Yersinia enterocolitica]ATM86838.1 aldo/keto reductase [Yersinia frederiksenii]MCB5318204.1 aldo/keto reductase [Yersinia massiliensis]CNL88772.1 aldo-keto reductase [Yersinia frederiksenii]CQH47548.1 aldo-keto reductase [Yersinia frederiksenii]
MGLTSTRPLGNSGFQIPTVGVGTCPLGELFEKITEQDAQATLETAWDSGIRLYDTAPWYGRGQGEHRTGRFLYRKDRDDYVLSTKVGRRLFAPHTRKTFQTAPWQGGLAFDHIHDYSYGGILRSYEDSLQRLGINKVDILYIHDLDTGYFPNEQDLLDKLKELESGGFKALEELKAAGEIAAFGAGINEVGMINRFLDRYPLDVFLVASRYTLLEQTLYADELLRAQQQGAGIVIGGVFNSGVLATGIHDDARYDYGKLPHSVADKVRKLQTIAADFAVPLAAAALQFPLGFSAVASVLYGPSRPAEVTQNSASFQYPIPTAFWLALREQGLIAEQIPLPGLPV